MSPDAAAREVDEIIHALRLLMQYGLHAEAIPILDVALSQFGCMRLARLSAELRIAIGSASEARTALILMQGAFLEHPWDPEVVDLLARAFEAVAKLEPAKMSEQSFGRWIRRAMEWSTNALPLSARPVPLVTEV